MNMLGNKALEAVEGLAGGALRPLLAEYLQTARTAAAAVTAIAVGFVSCSFGVSSMGAQALGELAREVARGRDSIRPYSG